MATDTSLALEEAAARLEAPPDALTAALAEAVDAAGRPSASQCTLPGPILQVSFECAGRIVVARRESESARAWRFELL